MSARWTFGRAIMATIGILCPAASGHLNPMNSLGRELARRGHRVVVANAPDVEPAVLAAGLEFAPIGGADYPPGSVAAIFARLGELQGAAAMLYSIKMMIDSGEVILRDAPDAFRSVGVDLLVIDQGSAGGSTVADHLGVPYVTVANAILFNVEAGIPPMAFAWLPSRSPFARARDALIHGGRPLVLRRLLRSIAERRRAWGLPPRVDPIDLFSPFAEICQQPIEFEFPRRQLPPHFHFTGPLTDPQARPPVPFPFEALDGRPLVYASLGTIQNRLLWIFRAIAEAMDGLDVQLVISLGGSADPAVLGPLPGNPLVVRAAPQLELLDRARLTITHAGMNTTLESLARGVPLVAIPIANDQPAVAARIAWTGTGLFITPNRLTPKRLKAAVARVLAEPSFAANAARLRDAIARAGGVSRAADVVERLLQTGRPVLAEDFP
jgi:zeaxanthin glucosyltransferase